MNICSTTPIRLLNLRELEEQCWVLVHPAHFDMPEGTVLPADFRVLPDEFTDTHTVA